MNGILILTAVSFIGTIFTILVVVAQEVNVDASVVRHTSELFGGTLFWKKVNQFVVMDPWWSIEDLKMIGLRNE